MWNPFYKVLYFLTLSDLDFLLSKEKVLSFSRHSRHHLTQDYLFNTKTFLLFLRQPLVEPALHFSPRFLSLMFRMLHLNLGEVNR